jgi:hypothetical protein
MTMDNAEARRAVRIDQLLEFLRNDMWAPVEKNTPARNLTRAQAMEIIVWLLAWGQFTLRNRDELFVVKGSTILLAGADRKISISPPTINGVEFRYLTHIDKKGGKKSEAKPLLDLDPRLVVFLWKLATMLNRGFNVDTIYHIGFHGDGGNNCHGRGRALDFAGASGTDFDLTVAGNWSSQPVTLQKDYRNPKTQKTIPKGTVLPDWPTKPFQDVYFRLDVSLNPHLDPTKNFDKASDLFQSVYALAAEQCTDTSDASKSPTEIGPDSSFILHPDYKLSNPDPKGKNGREAHWQHMHMQIGPTGPEVNPPVSAQLQVINAPAVAQSSSPGASVTPSLPSGTLARGQLRPVPPGYSLVPNPSKEVTEKSNEVLKWPYPIGTQILITVGDKEYLFALEWHKHKATDPVPEALKDWHRGVSVYQRPSPK